MRVLLVVLLIVIKLSETQEDWQLVLRRG